jgi:hypothetical protein
VVVHNDEGHRDARREREDDVQPPEGPGQVHQPISPVFANENHHVDDSFAVSALDSVPKYVEGTLANPIGNVPKKRDCAGCPIMAPQISGYRVYRAMDMKVNTEKRKMFKTKKAIAMPCIQGAL